MKKIMLGVLIFLLMIALTFVNVPNVSATTTVTTTTSEGLWVTYGLSENISREPMPENFATEDFVNTTYSQIDPLSQVDEEEGDNPIYVLVFADEEEREKSGWEEWATKQLERGDNALVDNFGIDIRILGFEEWDSFDSNLSMYYLWGELASETAEYLDQWYTGEWWSGYVDAIIGITSQETPADLRPVAGLSPNSTLLDQGRIFILLKWLAYWADDNLVQHEVSHLFYAEHHYEPCCAMATHTHFWTFLWEDGLWAVFVDVPCSYTSYHWCDNCQDCIDLNKYKYLDCQLTISAGPGGTTEPSPGTYVYYGGTSVTVTAIPYSGYVFTYWTLDWTELIWVNPTTVTMNKDHELRAHFSYGGGGGGGCVAEGTLVTMADGSCKPVEKIKVGDQVLGFDPTTGSYAAENVLAVTKTKVELIENINNGILRLTPTDQPIYVRNSTYEGWLRDPGRIKVGWEIFDAQTSTWVAVTSIIYEEGKTWMYDLTLDGYKTYLANSYLLMDKGRPK